MQGNYQCFAQNRGRKVLLLHMGGTIGMVSGPKGWRPPETTTEYESTLSPTIKRLEGHYEPRFGKIEFDYHALTTADSNDLNPEMYEELSAIIHAAQRTYDAVIITHGTDTLASTASALNLAFQTPGGLSYLHTPVVITGAQKTIHTVPSDAERNFIFSVNTAFNLMNENYYPGIYVAFGDIIIDGANVIKTDERGFVAFQPTIASALIGKADSYNPLGVKFENINMLRKISYGTRLQRLLDIQGSLPGGRFLLSPLCGEKGVSVGAYIHTINSTTYLSPSSYLLQARDPDCLAILIRLTGMGYTSGRNFGPIRNIVKDFGLPVLGALGIPGGKPNQDVYEIGNAAFAHGLLPAMATIDAAEVKLAWSLAGQELNERKAVRRIFDIMRRYDSIAIPAVDESEHEQHLELPPVYSDQNNDRNGFGARLKKALSLVDVYRKFKGDRFRYLRLSREEALGSLAIKFLPQPYGRGDLTRRQETAMCKLTSYPVWTP